ncbi:MAG: alpha/beta hydrolase [Pseudomonadota bacterium]
MNGPDLSPEAQAFLQAFVVDHTPTDFARIAEVRNDIIASQTPNAERAIERHQLASDTVQIGGVKCERVTSAANDAPQGVLFYVFGGGFVSGSPYCDLPIIGALAEHCQVEVIAPWYRLAPEHPAPAAIEDCFAAWRAVAAAYQGPLLLAGESAGGNLALLVAQKARAAGIREARAMALLSPAVDLRTDPTLFEPTRNADPTLAPARVNEISAVYAQDYDATDPTISPLFGRLARLPPTIITTGTRDLLMPMCLRLERQMRRHGTEVESRVWHGLWHVFEYYDGYPEAAESLAEISAFLTRRMRLDRR